MTTQEMEKLPHPLERTISNLEMSVMAEVVDRIKQAAEVTLVADQLLGSLNRIGFDKKQMKEIIRAALKEADLDVDKIYETAVKADYIQHKELYEAVGKQYLPYKENEWLQQVVRAAKEQTKASLKPFENLTQTTGFFVPSAGKKEFVQLTEYFKRILDKNLLAIASGAKTYSQAVGAAIDEMTSSGLRIVNYASGHTDRVEVAARRALMTGIAQMVDKINGHNAKELNTKYWEVDWHPGARNTGFGIMNHQSWQGKVYDDKQMVSICGLGDILGFAGVNCYHVRFPFIPGVSKRKYTDEWLEEQNKKENTPKEYYGKPYDLYAALQHQRKLERTIRKQKQDVELLERAGADKEELTAALSRLQRTKVAYAEFSKTMGIPQQLERWRVAVAPKHSNLTMSAKGNEITDEDRRNINEIISFKSYSLNEKLRNEEPLTKEERLFMRGVDKAILKLPDYQGIVYRSVSVQNMPDEEKFNREHQPGFVVIYPAFTSASLEVYDDSMKYLLVILSKHGKDMTEYNPGEQEILFKRGSMFYVTGRDGNVIYMEEP